MIRHVVLMKLAGDNYQARACEIFNGFESLVKKTPGIVSYSAGPNVSPERLDRGYLHGFVMDFVSAEARDAYLAHHEHVAFAQQVVLPAMENGLDSITVFDYEMQS